MGRFISWVGRDVDILGDRRHKLEMRRKLKFKKLKLFLSSQNSLFYPTLFPETCSSWRIWTKNDRLALWLWFHFVYDVMWSLLSVAPQFSVILVNLKLHWGLPARWQLPSHCCCHALGGPCHARCHGVTHSVTRVTWPHHPHDTYPKFYYIDCIYCSSIDINIRYLLKVKMTSQALSDFSLLELVVIIFSGDKSFNDSPLLMASDRGKKSMNEEG